MAIIGTHMLLYSSQADALRVMLRDAFGFKSLDAGGGWLIFALPPSELGVHPAESPTYESGVRHQVTFMCDDIRATIAELRMRGVQIDGKPEDEGYGVTVMMTLPGGVQVMLYEPRHAMAITPSNTNAG
ncbi:MAG: VOC family protein [Acidobacteria bacterium]|nr:VOC family protein [Acidobacteriota bacterium]MCI0724294.1 VOC family protein [Acidobacteriota bacterium]